MSGKTGIKVFAPAAIANLMVGPGVLSMAVDTPGDEIIAKFNKRSNNVNIAFIKGYKQGLSLNPSENSASCAGNLLLDHLNENVGIDLDIYKNVPLNSGFSSNASSTVAGLFAVNELLGRPLERYDLLDFAIKTENKFSIVPNNSQVCSILFGGIILYRNSQEQAFQKLYTPHGIQLTLIYPGFSIPEKEKLELLTNHIEILDHITYSGNLAAFVSSLYTSNYELFSESLKNTSLYRELVKKVPDYREIETMAMDEGAFGCGLAGFGTGFFIASPNSLIAEEIAIKIEKLYLKKRANYKLYKTGINLNGVYKY